MPVVHACTTECLPPPPLLPASITFFLSPSLVVVVLVSFY
jgi:hypothetical protein